MNWSESIIPLLQRITSKVKDKFIFLAMEKTNMFAFTEVKFLIRCINAKVTIQLPNMIRCCLIVQIKDHNAVLTVTRHHSARFWFYMIYFVFTFCLSRDTKRYLATFHK